MAETDAGAQELLLETVRVSETVFPASRIDGVYVGVKLVGLVILPFPLCVQEIVPLEAVTPETVAAAFEQMVDIFETDAVGRP